MQEKSRVNVVLADAREEQDWEFVRELRNVTKKPWIVKSWNDLDRKNVLFSDFRRFAGYFLHMFAVFLQRNRYLSIIAWQQFYGLVFAFYCQLFHVKKRNGLVVMAFIYNKRQGLVGRLYHAFISGVVRSGYVDKFVVYSSCEAAYYADLFHVPQSTFQYLPLGIKKEVLVPQKDVKVKSPFLLAVGRSNRDYGFLFRCVEKLPYNIVVLADCIGKETVIPHNVKLFRDMYGMEYLQMLQESMGVLIPLKDTKVSCGQLVMLQAMQYGKPVIVTDSASVRDYAKDDVNAIVCKKEEEAFGKAIVELMEDPKLRERLAKNGKEMFYGCFTLHALAKNVSGLLYNVRL